mgnify:CR=1 FL=1
MISIHALLAESDLVLLATEIQFENFYPRSPCGERPHGRAAAGCGIHISIHALLAESDRFNPFETFIILPFLSTLSLRRATIHFKPYSVTDIFLSTLSLRRATHCIWILCRQHPDFYPRSPCGERRGSSSKSTRCLRISIHALLAESDAWCMSRKTPVQAAFLSTLSLRRATLPETAAVVPSRQFLSTLSLRRATPRTKSTRSRRPYFYPRSPCGERHLHSKRHIRIH